MSAQVLFEARLYTANPILMFLLSNVAVVALIISVVPFVPQSVKKVIKDFRPILALVAVPFVAYIGAFFTELLPYYMGNYEIIEGPIEDFQPPITDFNKQESFAINGVIFEYSPHYLTFGYHNTTHDTGVIKSNMQRIRILYVYDGRRNIIMRVEQLE